MVARLPRQTYYKLQGGKAASHRALLYWPQCGTLPKVRPHRPNANPPRNLGPNQGLNYIEVIPSPFAEEEEKDRASLRVVTRAQAPKNLEKEEPQASKATQK